MAEANLLVPLPDDMARLMKLTKWQAAEIQRLRERVFELETDPHGGDVIPLAQPRDGELRRHCRRPPTQREADRDAGHHLGARHQARLRPCMLNCRWTSRCYSEP